MLSGRDVSSKSISSSSFVLHILSLSPPRDKLEGLAGGVGGTLNLTGFSGSLITGASPKKYSGNLMKHSAVLV